MSADDDAAAGGFLGLGLDTTDFVVLGVVVAVVAFFLYKQFFSAPPKPKVVPKAANGSAAVKSASTTLSGGSNSFIKQMNDQGKNAIFFFGSQTGTAEDYANRLAREAKQFGFKPMVADMEQFDLSELKNMDKTKVAFFVVSTYGEGEPTDNAQEAYKLYHEEEHEPKELENLNYVVFGLGNKTYEQFNAMGKFWDVKLGDLGGYRVYDAGVGDDDGNLEDDYIQWKDKMWPAVCGFFNIDMDAASATTERQFAFKEFAPDEIPMEKVYKGEIGSLLKPGAKQTRPPYDIKNPYFADLTVNRELFTGERSCMHIEVNIKDTPLTYATGDHLGVFATNDAEEVVRLAARLGITNIDAVFTMTALDSSAAKKNPFPCPTTYRTALSNYLDIVSIPRTHILKALLEYTTDEKEKSRLQHLVSPEGKDDLHKFLHTGCRHLLDVLNEFPSAQPPVDLIFELLPRLQCRYYSISSSPKHQPESVSITAVLVEYTTPTQRVAKGVATGWMKGLVDPHLNTHRLPVFVRKSNFKLPRNAAKGIIMVGPGTGLAPFRGFIQERSFLVDQGKTVGPNILFYGCRHPDQDFLYKEELHKFAEQGRLELHTAFSRVHGQPKVYVQQLIYQEKQKVWDVLQDGGCFYVCGDAKNMAREVSQTLHKIVMELGGQTDEQATAYLKKLRTDNRYLEDVWS